MGGLVLEDLACESLGRLALATGARTVSARTVASSAWPEAWSAVAILEWHDHVVARCDR